MARFAGSSIPQLLVFSVHRNAACWAAWPNWFGSSVNESAPTTIVQVRTLRCDIRLVSMVLLGTEPHAHVTKPRSSPHAAGRSAGSQDESTAATRTRAPSVAPRLMAPPAADR